jgi:hypothetical protein
MSFGLRGLFLILTLIFFMLNKNCQTFPLADSCEDENIDTIEIQVFITTNFYLLISE